jgi:hypothetical protein
MNRAFKWSEGQTGNMERTCVIPFSVIGKVS